MRRTLAALSVLVLMLMPGLASSEEEMPLPEPGFAGPLGKPGTCARPNPEGPGEFAAYGNDCVRLKFAYGPIVVQPGDNDTGLSFKTVEKPWYDGYMVGIAPNLVKADGSVPDIADIHLHHATWLSNPSYGNGPFFAAGEEKTIARFPMGYGMAVKASDVWYFVHMIHNSGTRAEVLWVTYHVDYVAKNVAETKHGMKPIKPFWLDVWKNGRRANYPVYNTHRGYGAPITDPITTDILTKDGVQTATTECTWPKDRCSAFDSWNGTDVGQGAPGNGKGTDTYATAAMSGTLIGIGGHLHPGGTRVEVDMVRCLYGSNYTGSAISSWQGVGCNAAPGDGPNEESARIFTSDAVYFDNLPRSWNFSMTVAGLPRWRVKLEEGWFLRINSVYETDIANWYENMGIAVAYVTPGTVEDAIDPFVAKAEGKILNEIDASACHPMADADHGILCTRGTITHGPLPEAATPGGANISDWPVKLAPVTDQIHMGAFRYVPGDLETWQSVGVPQVKRDQQVTVVNEDAGMNVFHTLTSCAYPCNGTTGIAYPVSDFGYGSFAFGDALAFDSAELGFSADFGPARGTIPTTSGNYPSDPVAWARDAAIWTFTPADLGLAARPANATAEDSTGIYTYYCRIHPFMRGAFAVVE